MLEGRSQPTSSCTVRSRASPRADWESVLLGSTVLLQLKPKAGESCSTPGGARRKLRTSDRGGTGWDLTQRSARSSDHRRAWLPGGSYLRPRGEHLCL